MTIEIKVPAMGESITQATIGTLIKQSGSYVNADEEIIELETDKVNQVLYAPQAGVITWVVDKDDHVAIGQVIGNVDTEKKVVATSASNLLEGKSSADLKPLKDQVTVSSSAEKKSSEIKPSQQPVAKKEGVRQTKEMFLSDLSPSIAPLSNSNPEPLPNSLHGSAVLPKEERGEVRQKMTKIRKVIATRLVDALQQTAMLTTFNEVDMSSINNLRNSYKEAFAKQYGVRLGYLPFFISACVSAMKAFPEINTYIDGEDLVYRKYFDIGIAVGTDRGVIVPVVRGCDHLSFAQMEKAIEDFAKKAREGGLSADDLRGGGFTITNGGVYGSLLSTPILNMPQSAILGMHKIMKRAVVVDDEIVIRPMMYLALSYDHRVVDGKEAVSFLVHIKNCLEDPTRLLLGVF